MKQSVGLLVISSCAVFGVFLASGYLAPKLASRVLPPWALALLLLTSVMNHIVFCEAVYLRAHKAEPFLISGLVFSILMGTGTYFLAKYSSVSAVVVWYFLALRTAKSFCRHRLFSGESEDCGIPRPAPLQWQHRFFSRSQNNHAASGMSDEMSRLTLLNQAHNIVSSMWKISRRCESSSR